MSEDNSYTNEQKEKIMELEPVLETMCNKIGEFKKTSLVMSSNIPTKVNQVLTVRSIGVRKPSPRIGVITVMARIKLLLLPKHPLLRSVNF